ncbi:MBL fold metallo-hydrolase [Candidatus Bathyarchaeota archaeon]|nr:MBL fold metallo-hydrolase [Candidatus Bathyarchaeota archaeon]
MIMMQVHDSTVEFDTDLFYIDTFAHGRKRSIGILIYREGGEAVVFDSGMPDSTSKILSSLDAFGIKKTSIRHLLLSHRHIDHAGAASTLLTHFPNALVRIHPFSAKHLAEPSKIYRGGRELFGDYAAPMSPVSADLIRGVLDGEDIHVGKEAVQAIYAPGHTSDHVVYYIPSRRTLYCGDAVGAYDTTRNRVYPTCMYPSFDYEKYKSTLCRILQLDLEALVFPHFGVVSGKCANQILEGSLSAYGELEEILKESAGEDDEMKITRRLMSAFRDATEIFPESVRERAAEYMARGFLAGSKMATTSS